MIRPVPAVCAMQPYALADLDSGLFSLAQNESHLPPSPAALAAGQNALAGQRLYPDPDWHRLRQAIAQTHALDPDRLLCGAGSMELIGSLIRAYSGPGDEVLAPQYGYLYVATACRQAGSCYRTAPEADYTVSVDALLQAVTPATRILFLCNPGNPTGTRIGTAEILRLRHALPDRVLLVVDQAYAEFDPQDPRPVFSLTDRGDTVVTRTFSKAYALAGARVGWGLFPHAIAAETRKLLNPNNVSGISQAMAEAAIADQAHMRASVAAVAAIRDRFAASLRAGGYPCPESHTNFVLIPFPDARSARAADDRLHKAGYLLRGMGGYGLVHCLRATVAEAVAMSRVAEVLRDGPQGV